MSDISGIVREIEYQFLHLKSFPDVLLKGELVQCQAVCAAGCSRWAKPRFVAKKHAELITRPVSLQSLGLFYVQ
jgi:hypothetical protein